MLKGIDISSWQENIDLLGMPIDFVIVKATEATDYVNPWCDPKVQQARKIGLKWGFYHYAKNNSAEAEAQYFFDNCKNYFGEGIPVLDWEEKQSVNWVNTFVRKIHELTGIWCWIYANPWRFNQGGVEPNCARWIASYPAVTNPDLDYDPGAVPQTDGLVCCWQYASDGRVPGYNDDLDLNHYFGDRLSWDKYAFGGEKDYKPEPVPENKTSILENDDYKVTIEEK